MDEEQQEQNDESGGRKDRALDPQSLHNQDEYRLRRFQAGASILDAAVRLLDVALRWIR